MAGKHFMPLRSVSPSEIGQPDIDTKAHDTEWKAPCRTYEQNCKRAQRGGR